jgi:hypothetical protein
MAEAKVGKFRWLRETLKWFAILVGEEMVRAKLPDYLPYALLIIAAYLTAEIVLSGRVRALAHRVYLACSTRYRMWTYLFVFALGGCLLCFYWWAIGKTVTALENRKVAQEKIEPLNPLARTEFLLEAAKPLREVYLIIDLKERLTPEALKHFRAMITIANTNTRYANATNQDNRHPTLCVGGRDSYPLATINGREIKWFGVSDLVWALNPDDEMLNTQVSTGQTETSQIILGGGTYGKSPFRTLADLDAQWVNVYMTEPLFEDVSAIHFVGNDYILLAETADNLAKEGGAPLVPAKLLDALMTDQQDIKWISLMPKGSDYERFQKEKQQLGHDPEWFPYTFYRLWSLEFSNYTPTKLTPEQRLALSGAG